MFFFFGLKHTSFLIAVCYTCSFNALVWIFLRTSAKYDLLSRIDEVMHLVFTLTACLRLLLQAVCESWEPISSAGQKP